MNKNNRDLLNSVLSKNTDGVKAAIKAESMKMVEGTRQIAAPELFRSTQPLPEASEQLAKELAAATKLRDLPDLEDDVTSDELHENVFAVLNAAIDEGTEQELQFESGDVYVITPDVARELLDRVTPEELEEAAMDHEAFTELVHGALDDEFEVDIEDIDDEKPEDQ